MRSPESIRVLIGCEFMSGVRNAFLDMGFDAYSCDLLPDHERSNRHIQDDLRNVLQDDWDFLMVAHPPCTDLCGSGVQWLTKTCKTGTPEQRWERLREGAKFFADCYNADIPCVVVENPVMSGYAMDEVAKHIDGYTGPTQYVHPYYFGDPFFKKTGLLNKNMPPLEPTEMLTPPKTKTDEHKAWSAIHRAPPGPNRWKFRSRTFPSICKAMATQYGAHLINQPQEAST